MAITSTKTLFNRAILQSPSLATQTPEEAHVAATAIAALLGVRLSQEAISAVPLPALIAALKRLADDAALRKSLGFNTRNFFPIRAVVDGEMLKAPPLQAMAAAWQSRPHDFSMLVGCNREEMRLYAVPTGAIEATTEDELREFALDAGASQKVVSRYTIDPATGATRGPGETLCAMQSDYFYRNSTRKIATDASAAGVTAYLYEFDWSSPKFQGRLGAGHGVEIPFVFKQPRSSAGVEIAGAGAPAELAETMHGAWVRFVKEGRPGWPAHDSACRSLMHFDENCRVAKDHFIFWDG